MPRKLDPEERRVAIEERRAREESAERKARAAEKRVEKQRKSVLRTAVNKAMRDGSRHRRYGSPKQPPHERVAEIAEAFFEGSIHVIQHHLKEGDLRAALFVAGRVMDGVESRVTIDLKLADDATPLDAANAIVRAMTQGKLPVNQAERMLRACESAANLSLGEEIEELREMIKALGGDTKVIEGTRMSPAWLKLQQDGPKPAPEFTNGHANGKGT